MSGPWKTSIAALITIKSAPMAATDTEASSGDRFSWNDEHELGAVGERDRDGVDAGLRSLDYADRNGVVAAEPCT